MIKVKYKGKIWNLLCPKNLHFPKGCIRNVLIERRLYRIITNINQIERIGNYSMEGFL
jgi:hypothetical protein